MRLLPKRRSIRFWLVLAPLVALPLNCYRQGLVDERRRDRLGLEREVESYLRMRLAEELQGTSAPVNYLAVEAATRVTYMARLNRLDYGDPEPLYARLREWYRPVAERSMRWPRFTGDPEPLYPEEGP